MLAAAGIAYKMKVGLVSDTHGVFDQDVALHFTDVDVIIHAGDVGNRGGHHEVLQQFKSIAPVHAVAGNVDTAPPALPGELLLDLEHWRILITHIVGDPPKRIQPGAAQRISSTRPDLVVFGHSHKALLTQHEGILYVNPGSAGPARFRLPRTIAILDLPAKNSGALPHVEFITLNPKAPPRLMTNTSPPGGPSQHSLDAGPLKAGLKRAASRASTQAGKGRGKAGHRAKQAKL